MAEKVFEKVEEDLSVSTIILTIDHQRLLNLHVNISGVLCSQISWSILVEPFFTEDVQNVSVVLLLETLWVEL